jgi:AAA family ATP:ADP antiporter
MLNNIIHFFYPDIKKDEILKFCLLGLVLFLILGSYWALLILKEFMIYKVAFPTQLGWRNGYGREIIPWIKTLSPCIIIIVIGIYTRLIDIFEKHKLFYIFCNFFAIIFTAITLILIVKDIYGPQTIGAIPLACIGITSYILTDCFGSLLTVLFWSFTVSSTKTNEAKRCFPLIITIAQLGPITGSSLLLIPNLPEWPIYLCSIFSMLTITYVIHILKIKIPAEHLTSDTIEKKQKPDFFAGIRLLITEPYLFGVFIVSTFYEIAKTIVDYQMTSQADIIGINFKWFMSFFAISVNTISFFIALLGTSYIIKKCSLQICLMIYPITFSLSLFALYFYYQSNPSPEYLLWATFYVMIITSAIGYAINKPTKEIMYIPTSKDAQFKVKGITDTIGSRTTKATGIQIGRYLNIAEKPTATIKNLMSYGTLICFGIISIWLVAAIYVGKKNKELHRDKKIIG